MNYQKNLCRSAGAISQAVFQPPDVVAADGPNSPCMYLVPTLFSYPPPTYCSITTYNGEARRGFINQAGVAPRAREGARPQKTKQSPLHKFHYCSVVSQIISHASNSVNGSESSSVLMYQPPQTILCVDSQRSQQINVRWALAKPTPHAQHIESSKSPTLTISRAPGTYIESSNSPSTPSTNRAKKNKTHTHTSYIHTKPYKSPRPCPLATRRDNTAPTTRIPRPRNFDWSGAEDQASGLWILSVRQNLAGIHEP